MDRTTVYIPLFPAAGPTDPSPGRLLALGFEPRGPGFMPRVLGLMPPALAGRRARPDLGGPLGRVLDQVRDLLARAGPAAVGRATPPGSVGPPRCCLPLEPVPDLTDCAGAGLGLALGLALGPGPAAGRRLLAFGRLTGATDGAIGVAPLADPGPVLDLLDALGPQPEPLLCLLPTPSRPRPQDPGHLAALAAANLHCRWVDGLPTALRACRAGPVPARCPGSERTP